MKIELNVHSRKFELQGNSHSLKAPESVGQSDQIKQLKSDMSKMSADDNRQYEEFKKLIVGNAPQPRVMGNPGQSSTVSRGPLAAPPPFRSLDNRRFASAGETAMMSGRPPQMNQSPGYLVCWDCGIPGHVRRVEKCKVEKCKRSVKV